MQNIHVNDTHDFKVSEDEISKFDAVKTTHNHYHILNNNSTYNAEILTTDFQNREYTIKVNNTVYTVKLEHPLKELVNAIGLSMAVSKEITDIKAPMPGLIIDVSVKAGDEVEENQPLLVLEAMKMENSITSPRNGVIKSVSMKNGDAVDKNEVLIEFE